MYWKYAAVYIVDQLYDCTRSADKCVPSSPVALVGACLRQIWRTNCVCACKSWALTTHILIITTCRTLSPCHPQTINNHCNGLWIARSVCVSKYSQTRVWTRAQAMWWYIGSAWCDAGMQGIAWRITFELYRNTSDAEVNNSETNIIRITYTTRTLHLHVNTTAKKNSL